jgi:FkbM family methyltransferase
MTFLQKIQNLFFPLGSIQKIRVGYLKGYKIRLSENSLWSPLLGRWEPAMQKIMVNVVRPGDIVYDLGANNGLHGLLMSGLVGEKGVIYNFEPFAENIAEIVENYAFNSIENYVNIAAAVADQCGTQRFEVGGHQKQGAISANTENAENVIEVKTINLDAFIEQGNPGPNFIKIDIEGAEGKALLGFSTHVKKYQPLMIIELHTPEQDVLVGKFLSQEGYAAYRFDTFAQLQFTKVKDLTKPHPAPDGIWGSIFCLPAGKQLEDCTFNK